MKFDILIFASKTMDKNKFSVDDSFSASFQPIPLKVGDWTALTRFSSITIPTVVFCYNRTIIEHW